MLLCWSINAEDRPCFSSLVKQLNSMLERESGYMDLSHTYENPSFELSRSLSWKKKSAFQVKTTVAEQTGDDGDEMEETVID